MTASAIGLELEKQYIDTMKGEHLTPEFLKVRFLESMNAMYALFHLLKVSKQYVKLC